MTSLLTTSNVHDQETLIILLINKLVYKRGITRNPFCLLNTHVLMFPINTIIACKINIYHIQGIHNNNFIIASQGIFPSVHGMAVGHGWEAKLIGEVPILGCVIEMLGLIIRIPSMMIEGYP